jgi:TonB family protein
MWYRFLALVFLAGTLFAQTDEVSSRAALNRGVAAFKQAHYGDAVAEFEQAVKLDPESVNTRLYLATAYMVQWVPGTDTAENEGFAHQAEAAFRSVLDRDPNNRTALASLASLAFNRGKAIPFNGVNGDERIKSFDESANWYRKLAQAYPDDKIAFYSLGVIAWERFYPALMAARARLGMKPEDPGPLKDFNERGALRSQYGTIVEDGMANLTRALVIDGNYDDAMAYLNLLHRERADYRDTVEEAKADIATADELVAKALEARKRKAEMAQSPTSMGMEGVTSERIRVGGNIQAANLLNKVNPFYPPLARQARIQGTVRFSVIIAKDGTIRNLQLVRGHPLLVPPATEAVRQWTYKPTLLNGQPVEVITQVDVNFTLSN